MILKLEQLDGSIIIVNMDHIAFITPMGDGSQLTDINGGHVLVIEPIEEVWEIIYDKNRGL